MNRVVIPGGWPSPLSAARVAESQISLSEPRFDGEHLCWVEGRPGEGGRMVQMGHNLPHAYLIFEGERHGFRRSDSIRRALQAELFIWGQRAIFTIRSRPEGQRGL